MPSTVVFGGILKVRRNEVRFSLDGEIYVGKCDPTDNMDNIVASDIGRCDSAAMPISIDIDHRKKTVELTFRISNFGKPAGFTSIYLVKRPRKQKSAAAPGPTPIIMPSGQLDVVPEACVHLLQEIGRKHATIVMQTALINRLMYENACLKNALGFGIVVPNAAASPPYAPDGKKAEIPSNRS